MPLLTVLCSVAFIVGYRIPSHAQVMGKRTMHTVALVSRKGGTGKSTLAIGLAIAAMEAGHRVCLLGRPVGDRVELASSPHLGGARGRGRP